MDGPRLVPRVAVPNDRADEDGRPATRGKKSGLPTRRALLRAAGLFAAGTLAGCDGGGGTTPTATTTPTSTATATRTPGATPSDAELTAAARTFVEHMAAGEFDRAAGQFSPATPVDAATLESVWSDLQRQVGAFVSIEGTDSATVQGYDAVVVTAQFGQGRQGLRVVFDGQGRIIGLNIVPPGGTGEWQAPDYVDRSAIATTDVTVPGPGDCALPGEVTVPAARADTADADVPSFVLLGGSGPTDMDATIGPNKPYRDLAWGLASDGAASSLRYTKRTAACEIDLSGFTIDDEYTTDARAAVETLRGADGTDDGRTVIAGHSLGAYLVPRVARRVEGVAGMVMLAPPGRPLPEIMLEQVQYLARRDGTVTDAEQQRIDEVRTAVERIRNGEIGPDETVLGAGRAYWESLQEYDPFAAARAVDAPVLLVRGERDYQVTETDLDAWREALADTPDVTIRTYESLNHLLIPGSGQPGPDEYQTPGHVDPAVIEDLGAWLQARWSG